MAKVQVGSAGQNSSMLEFRHHAVSGYPILMPENPYEAPQAEPRQDLDTSSTGTIRSRLPSAVPWFLVAVVVTFISAQINLDEPMFAAPVLLACLLIASAAAGVGMAVLFRDGRMIVLGGVGYFVLVMIFDGLVREIMRAI